MPPQAKTKDDGRVTVKLAHPLAAQYARVLGLDDRDYDLKEELRLTRDRAQQLIVAGYAQVDPEDAAAVAHALGPQPVAPPADATPSGN